MITEKYGVMALKFEFWLSAIIFIGGGALIWHDQALVSQVFLLWGVLLTFWFNRRQSESTASSMITQQQQTTTALNVIPPVQESQTQPQKSAVGVQEYTGGTSQ